MSDYRPTGRGTPYPRLLTALDAWYTGRWVSVTEALPPQRLRVLVQVRSDDTPAYAWLKFAAGDRRCPYFVCPQTAAVVPRGRHLSLPKEMHGRLDVTHWYSPSLEGLPDPPPGYEGSLWGLAGNGWQERPTRDAGPETGKGDK